MSPKTSTHYVCSQCQHVAPSFLGKCPECHQWGTLEAETTIKTSTKAAASAEPKYWEGVQSTPHNAPIAITDISTHTQQRIPSGITELDRVLGGGVCPGSYVLIGGDPGIGKSTLMLQMAHTLAKQLAEQPAKQSPQPLWIIAGEESPAQIRQRAERLGATHPNIHILAQTKLEPLLAQLQEHQPPIVIVDSIQSLYTQELSGTPGSVNQIKACATALMQLAKSTGITVFLVGHVTKDGQLSGPKVLEHLVDTVLYFEGDRYRHLRILRAVKNRFGNTQEMGVFEIDESGLHGVSNPSGLFMTDAHQRNTAGSVVSATLEGARPLLVEVQALVGQTTYSIPRRLGNGVDVNRLHKLVAILERRVGLDLSKYDVYLNVVGGLRIDDPAIDLAAAMAIISSFRDKPIMANTVVFGEVGLTGEVRPVPQPQPRLTEAAQLGLTRAVMSPVPKSRQAKAAKAPGGLSIHTADGLLKAIPLVFGE